jgi:hypothetical protein
MYAKKYHHFKLALVAIVTVAGIFAIFNAPVYAQEGTEDNVTELPDGTVITEEDDGTIIMELPNGLTLTFAPDGLLSITGINPSLEIQRGEMAPGEASDGTAISPGPDDSVQVDLPSGWAVTILESNDVEVQQPIAPVSADEDALCTFTALRYVNTRSGPGTNYETVGTLAAEENADVFGQDTDTAGFVWWDIGNAWVRADLGDANCGAVCGDAVCEGDETRDTCPRDCLSALERQGCLVGDCEACYESIDCYPECSECTCSTDENGCPTCYCSYPEGSGEGEGEGEDSEASAGSCLVSSCDACYQTIDCYPDCNECTCTTNAFGCPTCYCDYSETADDAGGCVSSSCEACYESIDCYPACSECTCSTNENGCPECYCSYPAGTE